MVNKTIGLTILVIIVLGLGSFYLLVYEPAQWLNEIEFYTKDAAERGAGVTWNEWPVFGDVQKMD
jgi:uncharacterized protein involved in cysteine biosynthesis